MSLVMSRLAEHAALRWHLNCLFITRGRHCIFRRAGGREGELMATTSTKPGLSITPSALSNRLMPVNTAPTTFDAARDLPAGFLEFLAPLHAALTLRQRALVVRRETALQ